MSTVPKPPPHLSHASKKLFRAVAQAHELEPWHVELLIRACEAADRADQARDLLAAEGLTVVDRYSQLRPHPAASIEIQNRTAEVRILRELQLGGEEVEEPAPRSAASRGAMALARKRWAR